MADSRYGIYRAPDTETVTTSFISDVATAVVLETRDIEKETVNEVVESLRETLKVNTPTKLDEFQAVLDKELAPLKSDKTFSAACGLMVQDVIYVIVFGGGAVLIHRDATIQPIIEGDLNASGKVESADIFIFETHTGKKSISTSLLKEFLNTEDLMVAAELLTEKVGEKSGSACLMVSFSQETSLEEVVSSSLDEELHKAESAASEISAQSALSDTSDQPDSTDTPTHRSTDNTNHPGHSRSKKLTFAAVILLIIVLVWSVVFGVQRRANEMAQKKIFAAKEFVQAKLEEATNVAPLNIERATVLITEAQNEIASLQKSVGKSHQQEVDELANLVKESSNKIINKQDKSFEIFYDLALIDKSATADTFYLSNETLALLNSQKGEIYLVSASKKSNEVVRRKEIRGAQLVGTYDNTTFFLNKDKGIYTFNAEEKLQHPIEKEGFVKPQSIEIFNANIYVLDSGAGDIFKYLSTENGYSKKASYFGDDQSGLLKGADDFAIDSSVYVLMDGSVIKYVSGARDTFKLSLPDKNSPHFTHIYTNKDLDKVYLLDTNVGKVVIVAKNGEYDKQIESAIFKKATEFVVFDNKILVLVGQKIYSVAL